MKKRKEFYFAIIILGISTIVTQIILIREFLSVFSGLELVFGIILANWLIITGIGSILGRKLSKKYFPSLQMLLGIIPLFLIFTIRIIRHCSGGEMIGITQIFLLSFIILLPFCIISGMMFALGCNILKKAGKVYLLETLGSVIGALAFSFFMIYYLNHFQTAIILLIINAISSVLLVKKRIPITIITAIMIISFLLLNPEQLSTKMAFAGENVVYNKDSPYGRLTVTYREKQLNFYENSIPLFTTTNTIANEETVHYAMSKSSGPESVLLIGGGISGTIDEIMKYGPERIDYVELDPEIINIGKSFSEAVGKVNLQIADAREFVKRSGERYDVAIIDLPNPTTAQINRYYTIEFFRELKRTLNENGIISFGISGYENYVGKETRMLHSSIYSTLKRVFRNILIIPGERTIFVASDKELDYNFTIKSNVLSKEYIDAKLGRMNLAEYAVSGKATINEDFRPVAYFYNFLQWNSRFRTQYLIFIVAIILVLLFILTKAKPITFSLFTAGFAGASLEVVLLIVYQIINGSVYHTIGLIAAIFMLGLLVGSFVSNRYSLGRKWLKTAQFAIVIFSFALPLIFLTISIYILTFTISSLVGFMFPIATRLYKNPSALYFSDLLGAAVGSLTVSSMLIPVIGIADVCFVVAVLNLISAALLMANKR
ncbi:hypothetical protein JXA85_00285 [Candidatus Woesearchaeota archaeon]|nr:hypothetical protein [Candidatus Woesearchaeota archaeon]